ncbi:MAG: hypothetical protein ACR2OZ_19820 [Verrucomicrobiales bacterium]
MGIVQLNIEGANSLLPEDRPLPSVLPRHVEAFRDLLTDAGRAPSSLRLDIKIIGGIFALAVRQGLIAKNPSADVEMDATFGQSREPFTAAEPPGGRHALGGCGMRRGRVAQWRAPWRAP